MTDSGAADRFDAIYRARLAAGRPDWHDNAATVGEVLGYLDELLGAADPPGRQPPALDVLELGCGTGTLSFPLAERGYRVLGLDISAVAVAQATARSDRPDPRTRARFQVHDLTRPLARLDRRFDLVIDSLVLHYLTRPADRSGMLRLAARALRPGGALLVMTMCRNPRQLPAGAWFDVRTRCLISGGQAECHYPTSRGLTAELRRSGWHTEYRRIVSGDTETGDQDMFLAVLKTIPADRSAAGTSRLANSGARARLIARPAG
jgi:SAM-dependent methyltransferase